MNETERPALRRLGHVAIFVSDIDRSRRFYQEILGLKHSGTAGVTEDALNVLTGQSLCFLSCGRQHHDLVLVLQFDRRKLLVSPEPNDLLHLAFDLQPNQSLGDLTTRLRSAGIQWWPGPLFPDPVGRTTENNCVRFRDPDGYFVEVHEAQEISGESP